MIPSGRWRISIGNLYEGYCLEATSLAVLASYDAGRPKPLDYDMQPPMDAEVALDDPRVAALWQRVLELEADRDRHVAAPRDDSAEVTLTTDGGKRSFVVAVEVFERLQSERLRGLGWTVQDSKPSPPWSITYADGSANVYRLERVDETVRFRYEPVTPATSSTGMYSGGDPIDRELHRDSGGVQGMWQWMLRLEVALRHHVPTRNKGDGAVTLVTKEGTRTFFVSRVATRDLEEWLERELRR